MKVESGETLALLGRNGAGKTTTLKGIVGLLPGARGRIVIGGRELGNAAAHKRSRAGISYVPSGARCFPNLTVAENLEVAARNSRDNGAGWNKERVFTTFPILSQLKANMAGGLSGGERQMLAIGRSLMSNPAVILMDEPTEGLAPVVVQRLGKLILDLKAAGFAIVLAEQNHHMALRIADRAAFMEKGRIVDQMPASEASGSKLLERILGV
jgi:branched-chain amino acid transport system ATP-binding protein